MDRILGGVKIGGQGGVHHCPCQNGINEKSKKVGRFNLSLLSSSLASFVIVIYNSEYSEFGIVRGDHV